MKLVIDTSVLVRAALSKKNEPNASRRLVVFVLKGRTRSGVTIFYDRRILEEYLGVLSRPKFRKKGAARKLVARIKRVGKRVKVKKRFEGRMPGNDRDDVPFVEVAVAAKADAIVTYNERHFPKSEGFVVATAKDAVEALRKLGHDL